MKNGLVVLVTLTSLAGCQTTIDAQQYSVLDPEVNFYIETPIVVDTFDENDLSSKFYIRSVIDGLHDRGFKNVYTVKEVVEQNLSPEAAAYIRVGEKYDTYTYTSADYGMVDSGYSTTNCTGFGVTAYCNTTKQKTFGVTGSSTKVGSMIYHSFELHYYNLKTNEKVLFTLGSTFDKTCNKDFLYEFLIDETLSRTNFIKPEDYKYTVKLPDGTSCK
ncbi:hypothetical protein [Aliivibrio fischeri]|uniref:hypothetical protein n=1 Tax=Aliivibrio fischeri TaxID=668 RepID=UPI00080DC8A0|nr:hypothetical protein [Aliivibrio fischeri]MUH98152.1 hypothetical protein [Aliivibrio fischeri]MUI65970.1 hypothetical protein [Aliivibrio fischeri]OCH29987.1 hypothetical protein A6D99_18815 [Aliivibrio fischeri]OED55537.1 hypothetical protein BEI46_11740 [Aliivibrio fischeri]